MKHRAPDAPRSNAGALHGLLFAGWHPYGWIFLLGCIVHLHTVLFGFAYFVDDIFILNVPALVENPRSILRAFIMPTFSIYYRPLVTVSLVIDTQIAGVSPAVYHAANVVYHLLTSCLVFALLARLQYGRSLAFLGASLFVVHPLTAQAVAWIPGRNDSLLALFALAAFVTFLDFLAAGRRRTYLLHIAFLALALLTKENAVALPVMCLLFLYHQTRRKPLARESLLLLAGWLAAGLTWFLLRAHALASVAPVSQHLASAGNIGRNAATLVELAGKYVIPLRISTIGVHNAVSTGIGAAVVLALLALVARRKEARTPMVLLGASWFVLFLLPTLVVRIKPVDYLETRAYTSLFGATLLLAELLRIRRSPLEGKRRLAVVPVVAALALITFVQESKYKTDIVFWSHAVEDCPRSHEMYFKLGMAYERAGSHLDEAGGAYRAAIALEPTRSSYHNNLGVVDAKAGRREEATEEFQRALDLDPRNAFPCHNLAVVYYSEAQFGDAERVWKRAVELNSNLVGAHVGLIRLLAEQGRQAEARRYARALQERGVRVDPLSSNTPAPVFLSQQE